MGRQFIVFLFTLVFAGFFGGLLSYERPPPRKTRSIFQSPDPSSQQVHISLVGENKMRISWITKDDKDVANASVVHYGTTSGKYNVTATGNYTSYKYMFYNSGQIHDVVIGPLQPSTVYYYRCGSLPNTAGEFSFRTPPAQLPIKFAIAGDLGQTDWTNSTLQHIAASNYDILLLPGDLSYADTFQWLWDSFGQLVQPLASRRPWMVTQGNHEVERIPVLHSERFTSFNSRWRMPFLESSSTSNLYYSFNVATVHVIMLGSYTDFDPGSDQFEWLKADLRKVDRKKTPWLIVLLHAPWYNSNSAHQGEYECVGMKNAMEKLLYQARVDVIFAGHVHAYERFKRVYNDREDNCGSVHITIGDGGNREGLATEYIQPKPKISVFREASFGHGQLQVVNETHALWEWHRNEDDDVVGDKIWLTSLASNPTCKASTIAA
ncbi:probable purple acid phosphatase 20 [Malania oleifera]|uniref:probable purple acid phosphatase 20 n=1 Tax=Malania oleifera TaxID=397392 RepID=UPI0025ADF5A4|nr:probable purple acid phosphatase 20 [Malania oleifera]